MELFTAIESSHAIIRNGKGVEKQVKLYQRKDRVYVPYTGGFVEVRAREADGTYTTAHWDVKLIDYEVDADHILHERKAGRDNMRWRP